MSVLQILQGKKDNTKSTVTVTLGLEMTFYYCSVYRDIHTLYMR